MMMMMMTMMSNGGGKKTRAVIGKLITSSSGVMEEGVVSPRSPLDIGGSGVGLGILLDASTTLHKSIIYPNQVIVSINADDDDDEEYTIVTRHRPNNSSSSSSYNNNNRKVYDDHSKKSLFDISPTPSLSNAEVLARRDQWSYCDPEFLSICHHCNKRLHGKDIYMYNGDKGFCSIECRLIHIGIEETATIKGPHSCSTSSTSNSHKSATTLGIFSI